MSPFSIGVSLALTGPERVYARQLRDAIQLACDDEQTPDPVTIVIEDDFADAAAAADAARRLASSDVLGVVGPMNSWTCAAQGPILAGAGLVQITPSASNPELTRCGWSGFFRMCPSDVEQACALAWVARQLIGAHRVGMVHDGTSFAQPLAAAFLAASRAQGIDAGPSLAVQTGEPASFLSAAEALTASSVDAVFIAGLEEPCRQAAVAIRAAGSRAVFLGTDAIKPTWCLVTDGGVDGPYLTGAAVDAREGAPAFHARFEARFGPHYSIYTIEAYDAIRILASAIRRANSRTRDGVREEMRTLGAHSGVGGEIRFDDRGERIAPRLGIYRWDGSAVRFLSHYTAASA